MLYSSFQRVQHVCNISNRLYNTLVEHEVAIGLDGLQDLVLGRSRSVATSLHDEEGRRVDEEDDGSDEDEPERVADHGLAFRAPAALETVFSDEDVCAQAQEVLHEPRDDGSEAHEEGNHVERY
jgi:hypothetical protein